MPAYIFGRINVTNPEQYAKYTQQTPAAVASFGGKFIVRGGIKETLEGLEETSRIVILEFPSYERAREFFFSPEYEAVKALRYGAADGQFILLDGYSPS